MVFTKIMNKYGQKKKESQLLRLGYCFLLRPPIHKEGVSRQSLSSRQPDCSFKPLSNLYHHICHL